MVELAIPLRVKLASPVNAESFVGLQNEQVALALGAKPPSRLIVIEYARNETRENVPFRCMVPPISLAITLAISLKVSRRVEKDAEGNLDRQTRRPARN